MHQTRFQTDVFMDCYRVIIEKRQFDTSPTQGWGKVGAMGQGWGKVLGKVRARSGQGPGKKQGSGKVRAGKARARFGQGWGKVGARSGQKASLGQASCTYNSGFHHL